MQLNLGNAIRRLRTERGMTQEELAAYTGVSFQAVSKWECGTTTPDIALLPKLAVFFGVRIDDLFGITDTDELERVDFILEHERLTEENFAYSKKVLDKALENHPDDVRVLKMYARLYLAKNQRDRLAAGRMLRQAMAEMPGDDEIFLLYRQEVYITLPSNIKAVAAFADQAVLFFCKGFAAQRAQKGHGIASFFLIILHLCLFVKGFWA